MGIQEKVESQNLPVSENVRIYRPMLVFKSPYQALIGEAHMFTHVLSITHLWVKQIKNLDQLSQAEAETGAELGNTRIAILTEITDCKGNVVRIKIAKNYAFPY